MALWRGLSPAIVHIQYPISVQTRFIPNRKTKEPTQLLLVYRALGEEGILCEGEWNFAVTGRRGLVSHRPIYQFALKIFQAP